MTVHDLVYELVKDERPRINPRLKYREEGENIVVFNQLRGAIDFLNPTASIIFKMCNGSNRIEDIVRHLHRRFPEVDIGKVRMDVIKAVRVFEKRGFLLADRDPRRRRLEKALSLWDD